MIKNLNIYITTICIISIAFMSCKNESDTGSHQHDSKGNHVETTAEPSVTTESDKVKSPDNQHEEELTLTQDQLDVLDIKIETISKRNMSGFIQVNGQLGVPPQNEAIVTSILGANINRIIAVEGDKVKKGQTLAYISHPDIITMQTNYLQTYNNLNFLEQDFNRQKTLYDAQVGSGRDYQLAQSAYSNAKGLANGFESQLRLLGISPEQVKNGKISQVAPIKSPIDGFIEKVQIKSGQYVQPQTALFEVVNPEHIHADLMVFEKDISKVKNGQKVKFNVEALGNVEMTANIYSVGKSFEEGPKALHIHAEIENKDKNLIPGMYVSARILTEESMEQALAEDAVFQEGEVFYVFVAEKGDDGHWLFDSQEVIVKSVIDGYIAFDFIEKIDSKALVAQSGAYYLMAEMKKSEAEHSH